MVKYKKEILICQPKYTLSLQKGWDNHHKPVHKFVMHSTLHLANAPDDQEITLLAGEGHNALRRDMHYALYLFQRFHMKHAIQAEAQSL